MFINQITSFWIYIIEYEYINILSWFILGVNEQFALVQGDIGHRLLKEQPFGLCSSNIVVPAPQFVVLVNLPLITFKHLLLNVL